MRGRIKQRMPMGTLPTSATQTGQPGGRWNENTVTFLRRRKWDYVTFWCTLLLSGFSLSLPPPPIQCHGKPGTDCEVKLLQKSKFLSGQSISKETEDPGSKLFHWLWPSSKRNFTVKWGLSLTSTSRKLSKLEKVTYFLKIEIKAPSE